MDKVIKNLLVNGLVNYWIVKKNLFCVLFLLVVLFARPATAQITTGQFRIIRLSWEFDKKAVVNEVMQFDEKEADAFWPVYDKYMKSWGRLMNYRIYGLQKCCDDFKTMTPAATSRFMNELFINDIELTKLQKKTYRKVRKVLSPLRSSQFMQIEYAFQLVLLSELQQRAMFVQDCMKKL